MSFDDLPPLPPLIYPEAGDNGEYRHQREMDALADRIMQAVRDEGVRIPREGTRVDAGAGG